jgi:uncharacterized membrane protein YccC
VIQIKRWVAAGLTKVWLEHILRTTIAATLSFVAARALGLGEAYWATISTIVVLQSTVGAAWTISMQRFAGTALGAATGALLVARFGPSALAYAGALLLLGLICALLRLDRPAYRFAGITAAVIMLVGRPQGAWTAALHRSLEVSFGIAIGLVLTAIWPERLPPEADAAK